MKPKIKQLFSGFLSTIITVSSIQLPASYGEGEIEKYPYIFFAGSSAEGAITINADNVCINGNIATNGTISSSATYFQVNGTVNENVNETIIKCYNKIDESYFEPSKVETYFEDYFLEDTNINIDTPIETEGNINLIGNINISSGLKALNDVNLSGNVENSQNSAIYSQTGDIIIDTENVNLNGIVYAPNGKVDITASNLNFNSVIIIADTITINCPNLNANYNAEMGAFIGKESESGSKSEGAFELVAFGEYLSENQLEVYWDSTVPQGCFDIQISNDNENYTSVATVVDTNSYEYTLPENFTQQYIKVVETTNDGKIGESIPFLITNTDKGYDIAFLDSDEDGLPDLYELKIGTQIDNTDSDEDGLSDYQEVFIVGSDPTIYDSITEGLADSEADKDFDGLSNICEINEETNPQNSDTDEDRLSDYDEIFVYSTDPLSPDSDDDNVDDGFEIKIGLDPNDPETFGIPDSEYKVQQSISSDSELLSAINTEENPYELSIEMKANGDIEKKINILVSGYSSVIDNDAMIGASIDITASDLCSPEDVVLKYDIKPDYINNKLGKYSSLAEFQNIKRLNVFKFDEEEGMLLPVNTEFSDNNTQLYAKVDELGTYCIMDMEIWLDNLGVEMPEMNTNISPLRLTYSAAANILATNNSNKSKPIDMVFILQTAGYDVDTFEKEKELISELGKYVFEKYSKSTNVNVHIITYGMESSSSILIDNINTYAKLKQKLNEITYNDIQEELCERSRAFNKLFNARFSNTDLYIYHLINGNSKAKEQYHFYEYDGIKYFCDSDNIAYLYLNFGEYTADSEIFPSGWCYPDEEIHQNLKDVITSNNDLFTSIDNVDISVLKEHFESKRKPANTYEILLPTKWKRITLKSKLEKNGITDSDYDELTDWEEVDTTKILCKNNQIILPTLKLDDIFSKMNRFSGYNVLLNYKSSIQYLPILSDPTNEDSDDDLISDEEERTISLNPLSSDTDKDTLLDGVEMLLGFDPYLPDPDYDDYRDDEELKNGTNPFSIDTKYTIADHIGAVTYGLVFGDFVDDEIISTEVVIGQIGGSFIPVVGTLADVRDVTANAASNHWAMAGINAIGLIPVAGDGIKAIGNLGEAVAKLGDDTPAVIKLIIEVAEKEPKLIKYFSKSDEVVDAIKTSTKSDQITKEALEKILKYADEAGIVIDKSSDVFKNTGNVMDTGQDVWNSYGACKRGHIIDDFINGHSSNKGLGSNFPVVDRLENGKLISTKSIDLSSVTYKDPNKLEKRLQAYIDQLNNFEKKYPKVNSAEGFKWGNSNPLHSKDYSSKVLELVIPDIPITKEQELIINKFIKNNNMELIIMKG